jgi:hypothetical protein
MKISGTRIAVAAAAVGAVGILATFPSNSLVAQVRAALVRDVDQPARQSVVIRNFTSTSSFGAAYTVPAGKRFVLEHMNCTSLGLELYAGVFVGTLQLQNVVYSVPVAGVSGDVLVADGDTRIYFEPGTVVNLRMFVSGQTICTLSGHTVDLNA